MCLVSVWHFFIIVHSWIIQFLDKWNWFYMLYQFCLVFLTNNWLIVFNHFSNPACKFLVWIVYICFIIHVISYLHCSILLGNSQRGQGECCMRGQWLSLRCQWELPIWMCVCVCFVVSCINFLFLCSSFNILDISLLKSSDLSMVNPHISLNPQNPPIHGAILRFSKDFYCEIHRFCWQSPDLAQRIYLVKSSSRSEEFIYFVWGISLIVGTMRLPFTQSLSVPLTNWDLQMGVSESWISQNTDLNTDHRSVCVRSISSLFSILFIHLIMKSSHVWGAILGFPSKSLDKSSDFMWFH